MAETVLMIELVKNIGFPAVIFAIWYIYHKSQVRTFETIIKNNFVVLKELLETNRKHTSLLTRIESKIDVNLWCPYIKKEVISKNKRNECE